MARFRLGHHLKTSLWFVPLMCTLAGIALSLVTTAVDDGDLIPRSVSGQPTAALQILYLIAFAMLTLTGLVLSLLVLAVQLAMGTFSPRIVRQILQDRPSQAAIGLFAATFAHAMLAMRAVETTAEGPGKVPGLAVVVAIVLVLLCIATLVWYLNHIGQSLRTAALVAWVADDTTETLDRVYPDDGPEPDGAPDLIATRGGGVVFDVGHERLVRLAERADCRFELLWAVGDHVPAGAPLVRVVGPRDRVDARRVERSVALGPERTLNQDVAYGIRMLVDIAERSLSGGPFADPTTTVQAIDRLHDIMRRIARRPLGTGEHRDQAGTLRLSVPTLQWDGFVHLAFDEIRLAAAGSPQVTRRLEAALHDLMSVAPPDRRPALAEQLALLEEGVAAAHRAPADRDFARTPDPSGIGSADALVAPRIGP